MPSLNDQTEGKVELGRIFFYEKINRGIPLFVSRTSSVNCHPPWCRLQCFFNSNLCCSNIEMGGNIFCTDFGKRKNIDLTAVRTVH